MELCGQRTAYLWMAAWIMGRQIPIMHFIHLKVPHYTIFKRFTGARWSTVRKFP